MRDSIVSYVLLVAILVVGIIQLFAGPKANNVGAYDPAKTTGITSAQVGYFMGNVGAVSPSSATTTLAASDICDNSLLVVTPAWATTTVSKVVLPASSTAMFANCLDQIGAYRDVSYKSVSSSTILFAGDGGTITVSSSTTIVAGKGALLRFMRDSLNTYIVYLVNVNF